MENEKMIDYLIYHELIYSPLEKVVEGIERNIYDTKDIKFLNEKLHEYCVFVAKLNFKSASLVMKPMNAPAVWNDDARQYYKKYYEKLLEYFKGFLELFE